MIADYEAEYLRQTGEKMSVALASKERIYLNTDAYRFFLAYRLIDRGCKMNLLKYSIGPFLDNLAAFFGLARLEAQKSVSRVRFTLSAAQSSSVLIPKGTRLSTPTKIYFRTKEDAFVPAGEMEVECDIESLEAGAATAGLLPGQISIIVDPVPYVSKVINIESSQGGADIESDESLRLRIYYFPASLSVAGPLSAYAYFVKSFSQTIEDVNPTSPSAGVVDIRFTMMGGQLPESAFINALYAYLEDKRPTTDHLIIEAPTITYYDLDCTYYIAKSDQQRQSDIISKVNTAVEAYTQWQRAKIGRDISPDMLTRMVVEAGAKRVPIRSPAYTVVSADTICRHRDVNVEFGGLEDD